MIKSKDEVLYLVTIDSKEVGIKTHYHSFVKLTFYEDYWTGLSFVEFFRLWVFL